jgi:hypothetical protein
MPIRLQFAVATKLKNPEVHLYQVDAEPQQIERTKRIVERVWEAIESQIFCALWLSRFMAESQQPVAHGSASSRRKRARSRRSAGLGSWGGA